MYICFVECLQDVGRRWQKDLPPVFPLSTKREKGRGEVSRGLGVWVEGEDKRFDL